MHENATDLRETVYDCGFILERYPGMAEAVPHERRTFFRWDEEKQGFFEAEEPKELYIYAY